MRYLPVRPPLMWFGWRECKHSSRHTWLHSAVRRCLKWAAASPRGANPLHTSPWLPSCNLPAELWRLISQTGHHPRGSESDHGQSPKRKWKHRHSLAPQVRCFRDRGTVLVEVWSVPVSSEILTLYILKGLEKCIADEKRSVSHFHCCHLKQLINQRWITKVHRGIRTESHLTEPVGQVGEQTSSPTADVLGRSDGWRI